MKRMLSNRWLKNRILPVLICISLVILLFPAKTFARDSLTNLNTDVTDKKSFAEYLGLNLTNESVIRWIEDNTNNGLNYAGAAYYGYRKIKWWRCYNINDDGSQKTGNQTGSGYNCTGFVWSVYYYTHWKNKGYYTNSCDRTNKMITYLTDLYGSFQGQDNLSHTGWFARWANNNADKIDHYHWNNLKDAAEVQTRLKNAESEGKIQPGDLIIYWNDNDRNDIHSAIYAGAGYQYEKNNDHPLTLKAEAGAVSYNTNVFVFPLKRTGWLQNADRIWYYVFPDGTMARSEYVNGYWLNKNGTWTYKKRAGWKHNKTGWWYGDSTGWYAKNQSLKIDRKIYRFDKKGYLY